MLRDENESSDELQVLSSSPHGTDDKDDDEDTYVTNAVVGLQAPKKLLTKVLTEE